MVWSVIRSRRPTGTLRGSALMGLMTMSVLLSGVGPSHARALAKLEPSTGAMLGAYIDPDATWSGNDAAKAETEAFEATIGRKVKVNVHFYSWKGAFPSGLEQWDIANGRTPLVSWEATKLSNITSGASDAMIRARADAMRALGKQVFLRWGHEMNGNWYAWDGTHNNDPGKRNGPAKYIAAWKRIRSIFTSRGASNVVFVWSPNNASVPNVAWNSWRAYYPGDAYVDWVGIDAYNWGTAATWSKWTWISSLIRPVYNDYASRKPIMLAETASSSSGGNKASWISNMRTFVKSSFPGVAAVLWFQVNKEADWRVDSTSTALSAYRAMGTDPYYTR